MISINHPFIVKLVKTLKKDNWVFLLEEYISGKNFGEYLDNRKHKQNIYETKFYSAILFEIISYLNKRKIIHRDIKPSNIMISYNGYLKLIDFGTSRKIKNYSETIIGTPNFIAPEVLLGKGYSFPCDYWSIGVCIYYIYFGTLPFGNNAIELVDIYKEIIEKEPEYPINSPFEIKNLISGLLCKKVTQRINSLDKAQSQNIFKDFPWDDLIKFKVKPFYIPNKDIRDNPQNLNIVNSPFNLFMENEKFETIQMQTLKINNKMGKKDISFNFDSKWYEDF
jgi:cGMP-dependent protein kinase